MTIELIDHNHRRDGTCQFCHLDRTLFPVKLTNGAWGEACNGCAKDAKEMP